MSDSSGTRPGSRGLASPINVLRVADAQAPSGFLLYSGITTHTVMGPASRPGPHTTVDGGSTVHTESRATQTDNNRQNAKQVYASRGKSLTAERSSTLNFKQQNRRGKGCAARVKPHSCLGRSQEGDLVETGRKKRQVDENSKFKTAMKLNAGSIDQRNQSAPFNQKSLCEKPAYSDSSLSGVNSVVTNEEKQCNIECSDGQIAKNNLERKSIANDSSHTYNTEEDIKTKAQVCFQNTVEEKAKTATDCKVTNKQNGNTIMKKCNEYSENAQTISNTNQISTLKISEQSGEVYESPTSPIKKEETGEEMCLDSRKPTTANMPIVWQESPTDARPESSPLRAIPVAVYSSMFGPAQPPASQNLPSGPRLLIPPRHSGPEGLTSKDIVQGTCISPGGLLSTGNLVSDEVHEETYPNDLQIVRLESTSVRRVKSASTASCVEAKDNNMTQNRPLFLNNRLIPRPATCTPISSKRIVSLEISIIPLGPDRNQQINKTKDKATDPSTKSPLCSASNLDTVEAIRRSYLRAQSAPPLASRSDGAHTSENARINSSLLAPTQSGLDDGRKFSSPYWRARSAYHRRNADVNEAEASDLKSLEFSGAHESSQLKGTLLRPLLYTSDSGFMKHSAGCPYKCKNCFRACLVSDDFAQKAQHRRQELISKLREGDKTNANHDPISKRIYKHKEHRLDAIAIVQRALARNQPLFQRVYGGKGHPPALLPWPTYAWVDIKQKKTDKDTGASSDDVL